MNEFDEVITNITQMNSVLWLLNNFKPEDVPFHPNVVEAYENYQKTRARTIELIEKGFMYEDLEK